MSVFCTEERERDMTILLVKERVWMDLSNESIVR